MDYCNYANINHVERNYVTWFFMTLKTCVENYSKNLSFKNFITKYNIPANIHLFNRIKSTIETPERGEKYDKI